MTSEQWAAWVSAGAAVVQAIGAGLAIYYSVKLARDAASREIAAEKAATERAERAERMAQAQAKAADEAAVKRFKLAQTTEQNALVSRALTLSEAARSTIEDAISKTPRVDGPDTSFRGPFFESQVARDAVALLPEIKERARGGDLAIAIATLQSSIETTLPRETLYGAMRTNDYLDLLEGFVVRIQQAENVVRGLRMSEDDDQ